MFYGFTLFTASDGTVKKEIGRSDIPMKYIKEPLNETTVKRKGDCALRWISDKLRHSHRHRSYRHHLFRP